MHRRSFIVAIGTATTLTAGCVSQSDESESGPTDDPSSTTGPSDSDDGSDPADSKTPPDANSRFDDIDCPSFAESDRTVCYHTRTSDDPDVVVEPSTELFEPTGSEDSVETMEFVLRNRTDDPFGLNPYSWSIYERTDNDWSLVAPEEYVEPWTALNSGETYTWRLSIEQHSAPMSEDTMAVVQDLSSGIYAFQITGLGTFEGDDDTNVECIALFEVQRTDDT